MSDVAAEFRVAVTAHLERLRPTIVPVLRQLINYAYPPEVALVDFEVFSDGFTNGFPVRAFFMDENNCEHFVYVDGNAEYPCDVDPGLMDIAGVVERAFEEEYIARDPDLDCMAEAGKALILWFAECWIEAGGLYFTRRALIVLHDDFNRFDLVGQMGT